MICAYQLNDDDWRILYGDFVVGMYLNFVYRLL